VARGQGGIRANVSQRDLKAVRLLLPSPNEQQSIAEALADASRHSSTLQLAIAKKQTMKQGMMQQLLTGRTRLPGFAGDWEYARWGEVMAECSSGSTPSRSRAEYWSNGTIPWITSSELNRGIINSVPQKITPLGLSASNLTVWPAGTFLMAITGLEAAGTRGSCGITAFPAATNQSCLAVRTNDRIISEFLYYYYLLRGDELAFQYCQGTKQQSYTAGLVRTLPIRMPEDIVEQQAIIEILTQADRELDALRLRLAKARDVKQGMMQQLLTGRTRLAFQE
jgi:type I restriction enzyme S subunit